MVPVASSATVAGTFAAAPAARRVKVTVVIVAAFMGLLNVAETVVVSGTRVAPFGGAWAVTVGATSVVKLHTEAVPSGVAMVSVTVAATVAVYFFFTARALVGVCALSLPAALTISVAGTSAAAPAARRVKVAVVIVAAAMGLLNVAETVVLRGTLIGPLGGAWAVTVGAGIVVKLEITGAASVIPAGSATVAAIVAV